MSHLKNFFVFDTKNIHQNILNIIPIHDIILMLILKSYLLNKSDILFINNTPDEIINITDDIINQLIFVFFINIRYISFYSFYFLHFKNVFYLMNILFLNLKIKKISNEITLLFCLMLHLTKMSQKLNQSLVKYFQKQSLMMGKLPAL